VKADGTAYQVALSIIDARHGPGFLNVVNKIHEMVKGKECDLIGESRLVQVK